MQAQLSGDWGPQTRYTKRPNMHFFPPGSSEPLAALKSAAFAPQPTRSIRLARMVRVAGQAIIALGMSSGCEREAPGPSECVEFARAWFRAHRAEMGQGIGADDAFDELVRRCLTEPYDRQLVTCVLTGQQAQDRCRVDYARRAEDRREERAK
jgi:hypothetical protein